MTKSELMQALWPEVFVEEANLTQHVFTLRKALGVQPERPAVHRDGPAARLFVHGRSAGPVGAHGPAARRGHVRRCGGETPPCRRLLSRLWCAPRSTRANGGGAPPPAKPAVAAVVHEGERKTGDRPALRRRQRRRRRRAAGRGRHALPDAAPARDRGRGGLPLRWRDRRAPRRRVHRAVRRACDPRGRRAAGAARRRRPSDAVRSRCGPGTRARRRT